MNRPPSPDAMRAHLTGDAPTVVQASGDDMRALLAYVLELERRVALVDVIADLVLASIPAGYTPLSDVGRLVERVRALLPSDESSVGDKSASEIKREGDAMVCPRCGALPCDQTILASVESTPDAPCWNPTAYDRGECCGNPMRCHAEGRQVAEGGDAGWACGWLAPRSTAGLPRSGGSTKARRSLTVYRAATPALRSTPDPAPSEAHPGSAPSPRRPRPPTPPAGLNRPSGSGVCPHGLATFPTARAQCALWHYPP